jgi:ankyrin repeat protein
MSTILELSEISADRNSDAADRRTRIVALLIEGADINASDKDGVISLHRAVRFRIPTAVKALIEHGANVNQPCRKSRSTPLHRAVTSTAAPGTAGKRE